MKHTWSQRLSGHTPCSSLYKHYVPWPPPLTLEINSKKTSSNAAHLECHAVPGPEIGVGCGAPTWVSLAENEMGAELGGHCSGAHTPSQASMGSSSAPACWEHTWWVEGWGSGRHLPRPTRSHKPRKVQEQGYGPLSSLQPLRDPPSLHAWGSEKRSCGVQAALPGEKPPKRSTLAWTREEPLGGVHAPQGHAHPGQSHLMSKEGWQIGQFIPQRAAFPGHWPRWPWAHTAGSMSFCPALLPPSFHRCYPKKTNLHPKHHGLSPASRCWLGTGVNGILPVGSCVQLQKQGDGEYGYLLPVGI